MLHSHIPLQQLFDPLLEQKQLKLYILRLDQTDKNISGNKWFKLKYNLIEAKKKGFTHLLTLGGAYSNHIHATAAAAKEYGFSCTGVIRGEAYNDLNATLTDAQNWGMKFHYINRSAYREPSPPKFIKKLLVTLKLNPETTYILPEGGTNSLALKGASEIPQLINIKYDTLCLPCGTGGTLAGISLGLKNQVEKNILGFSALKGKDFLTADINIILKDKNTLNKSNNWSINNHFHFGGFAKKTPELLTFMSQFYQQHQIELDFIYTAKMMYGIFDLCKQNYFNQNKTLVAIHTGGLQANRSLNLN